MVISYSPYHYNFNYCWFTLWFTCATGILCGGFDYTVSISEAIYDNAVLQSLGRCLLYAYNALG